MKRTPHNRETEGRLLNKSYCLLFATNLLLSLTLYLVNPLMSLHLEETGIPLGTAGAIIGSMSIASMLFRPASGWICDQFPRKLVLLVFTALTIVCLCGYAFAQGETLFFTLRILHGVSFGATTTVTMAFISEYLPAGRVSEGMGYFALGQSVATAAGPSLGLFLRQTTGGKTAFLAAALIASTGLVLEAFLPSPHASKPKTHAHKLCVRDLIAAEALPFALLTVALSAANGVETSYIAAYAQECGVENAGWYFTLSAVTLFLARLFLGRLSDRKSFAAVFYPGAALICLSFLLLAFCTRQAPVFTLAAASILKALGVGTVQPAIQAGCVSSVPPARRGAASSTYYIGADLGQGGATAAAGGIIAAEGYSGMFFWAFIPLAVSAILYFCYRRFQKREASV